MKTLLTKIAILILLIGSSTILNAQSAQETHSISVSIENIKSNEGHVLISLHTRGTFMKGPGIQRKKSSIVNGKINVTFNNIKPGTYAVLALHDLNDNNAMDFDSSGIPKESYGASNNEMSFGPPIFNNAAFELSNQDIVLKIAF
ncbi:DUF2141 domain-containing protein [Formosa sp. S-31]|uniref:DUF2141 domain-containing protein n=1 Tax=Formosa sp. S-31 TaxID=2790949 RepID=UPI003EBC6109